MRFFGIRCSVALVSLLHSLPLHAQDGSDERGKAEDVETKDAHPSKPLDQASLTLPDESPKAPEAMNLGGGLFPPELWPQTPLLAPMASEVAGLDLALPHPAPTPEEMREFLQTAPTEKLTDQWNLLTSKEKLVWQQFLATHAPATPPLRVLVVPYSTTPAVLSRLADAWSPTQPLVLLWIQPGTQGGYTAAGNTTAKTFFSSKLPKIGQNSFGGTSTHWLDAAKLCLLENTLALHPAAPAQTVPVAQKPAAVATQTPLQPLLASAGLATLALAGLWFGRGRPVAALVPSVELELPPAAEGPWFFPAVNPDSCKTRLGANNGGGHSIHIRF